MPFSPILICQPFHIDMLKGDVLKCRPLLAINVFFYTLCASCWDKLRLYIKFEIHIFGLPSFVIILSQKNNVIRRECAPQANIFILLPHSTPFSCLQVCKLTRLFSLFFPKLLLGHIFSGKYTPLELMARIIGNYCIEGKVVVRVNNGNKNMKISNSPVGLWLM